MDGCRQRTMLGSELIGEDGSGVDLAGSSESGSDFILGISRDVPRGHDLVDPKRFAVQGAKAHHRTAEPREHEDRKHDAVHRGNAKTYNVSPLESPVR